MDTYRGPNPLSKRMSITNSREFKEAIDLAIAGNYYILRDIAKYVMYNYNLCMHIKKEVRMILRMESFIKRWR